MSETLDETDPAAHAPPADGAGAAEGQARPSLWLGLRPLVMRLHFYVGVFVGPFVLVAAVTGLLYTLAPQLQQIVHHDALTVPAVGSARVDLATQVRAAAGAVPGGSVTEIRPASTPDGTTRVTFDAPGVAQDYSRTAFVDPYTGSVRQVLDTYGEWLPVRAFLDDLHRHLLLGDVGRVYSELAASWLWVLALSGVALWLGRRRRTRRLRRTLLPETASRGRARLRSWHGAVGLWAAVGMVFLSATGLTWSQFAGENVTALRSGLDWSTPSVGQELPGRPADPAGGDPATVAATADRVLAVARSADLPDPVALIPGGDDGPAWRVEQTQRSWPEKQDAVAVDPATNTVVDTVRFADWPLAAKLARWGVDAHMGLLFGVANQVALAALALAIICLVVWGYRMWWLRRPTRLIRSARPALDRSALSPPTGDRRPATVAVAVVGVVALALALVVPLLGVSLLVFLAGDALRQHLRTPRC